MTEGYDDDNKLDCRKENLRPANRYQNSYNASKRATPTASKYKGVSRDRTRWRAQIQANGKRYQRFCATEEGAARAFDEMARQLHGAYAVLNFPD